ncbi:hypothetical protein LNO36_19595 [Klebsiella variicola subsp. variicola]|nr:hypothetical protein [Klebsiella variicola subsp. variicola]
MLSALIGVTVGMLGSRPGAGLRAGGRASDRRDVFSALSASPGGAVALTAILGGAGYSRQAITLC